ncbi:hypothetical protein L2D01_00305 [Hyphomonadaceae bacterium ML37]|nr:hypothetical protein L2D01_00305 [Hyphomonadaceae bacterium ML37]
MTTRDTHPSGEDLAYLTAIARSGEDAPLLGGRFLVWWAGLTSLVILAHWSAMMGYGPLGAGAVWPLWIGYIVIGSAGQAALVWSIRHKPGQGAPANRTEAAVWMSAGLGIGAIFLGVVAGVQGGLLAPVFFNVILPVALAAYGTAWMTVAQVSRRVGLYAPALLAFAGAGAGMAFAATHWVYPVAALALLASSLLPGVAMLRSEPRSLA